jgi:hypothetical protein
MKIALPALLTAAIALALQQQPGAVSQRPAGQSPDGIPESAGDDIRGYNDTPQITGQKWKVHDIERPRPVKVAPGPLVSAPPPADATVLFDGKDLSQWQQSARGGQLREPRWKVENGYFEIVPGNGRLVSKEKFGDCQLHVEWMVPPEAKGSGQSRGNSGVELMTRYEIQVLESYENLTYADGGAGAIYGVWPPMVNPARPQGQWNVYDVFFEAPHFEGGKLVRPAYATVLFNGVLVHSHRAWLGTTVWRRVGTYTAHTAEEPLSLQDHNQPVRFRNIWIRKVKLPEGQ